MDRQNPRTNGKSKAIQTKSHTEACTYTHKKKKREKYIYISLLPKSTSSIWMISCLFRYSTDAGYIKLIVEIYLLLLRLLGEISLSLLCSHSSWGSALDLAPPLYVGRLRASVLRSDRTGLKEQLIWGLWLTQAGGREGYRCRCRASLWQQRPA